MVRAAIIALSVSIVALLALYTTSLLASRDATIDALTKALESSEATVRDLQDFAKRCVREELSRSAQDPHRQRP